MLIELGVIPPQCVSLKDFGISNASQECKCPRVHGMHMIALTLPPLRANVPEAPSQVEDVGEAVYHDALLLIAACQGGDHDAFRQLYEQHQEKVHRIAARMVGLNDAADVAQQVFLTVFRSIDRFHGDSRFETWLYRIAVNECLQHLRRARRWRVRISLDWEPTDNSHPADAMEGKEILERALARIDPELRAIFLLREVEQMAYCEIAKVLEISEGTVASRLNRARRELQVALRKLGWHPG